LGLVICSVPGVVSHSSRKCRTTQYIEENPAEKRIGPHSPWCSTGDSYPERPSGATLAPIQRKFHLAKEETVIDEYTGEFLAIEVGRRWWD
jgi:hypothetical protein